MTEISRRKFLELVPFAALTAACQPSTKEVSSENLNLTKAEELFRESGIDPKVNYSQANPEQLFAANSRIAGDLNFTNKMWKVFEIPDGQKLALALNEEGEALVFRSGSDGKPAGIKGLDIKTVELNLPVVLDHFIFVQDSQQREINLITYPASPYHKQKLSDWQNKNAQELRNIISLLFIHSRAPLNVIHLAPKGMPNHICNFPHRPDSAYQFTQETLPSPSIRGSSVIRYTNDNHTITRADIFISLESCKHEARILQIPTAAIVAGYLANESYGISLETYRLTHNLERTPGYYEGGSTGTDWAVLMHTMYNRPNPFFTSTQTKIIENLCAIESN